MVASLQALHRLREARGFLCPFLKGCTALKDTRQHAVTAAVSKHIYQHWRFVRCTIFTRVSFFRVCGSKVITDPSPPLPSPGCTHWSSPTPTTPIASMTKPSAPTRSAFLGRRNVIAVLSYFFECIPPSPASRRARPL